MSGVSIKTVEDDEAGMRLDRWFKAHYPGLQHGALQKLLRTGQVRVDGARVKAATRLEADQSIRVPPLPGAVAKHAGGGGFESEDKRRLREMTLYEDDTVLVLNKPFGLSVQGGPGLKTHIDAMLEALRDKRGQKPRLVHRLDRDTSGCLVIAKTRKAASDLARSFRSRSARKIYWALVKGVPKPRQGKISTWLRKAEGPEGEKMVTARHGDNGADHAVTYYAVIDQSGQRFAWLSLKPVTGRTHQLRVHMADTGHPILGDPKYFNVENWEFPGGLQNRLHLLARRIVLPHPDGGTIDATAPLPQHMLQSWRVLGFDPDRFDMDELEGAEEGA